jgi:hypothetical protein
MTLANISLRNVREKQTKNKKKNENYESHDRIHAQNICIAGHGIAGTVPERVGQGQDHKREDPRLGKGPCHKVAVAELADRLSGVNQGAGRVVQHALSQEKKMCSKKRDSGRNAPPRSWGAHIHTWNAKYMART